jgi:hypothetical protein
VSGGARECGTPSGVCIRIGEDERRRGGWLGWALGRSEGPSCVELERRDVNELSVQDERA